ncbi:UDP-N-acetylglucosamine 2-epimerase [Beutenbergia cavernae DSM 12333]|uniref:UDP-N-acetylglucosamine 2-epimerase (non-hydrolyzing) n=1 Tax=Beutenbergia cavernae (strain ATCC BAA-8 / DSM 12333 / CCUG 43141 / JCM 11478 / NBRC 16432 / NCIMB 13614 / HKI 0122) TaxID=471853 RepID=C5C152_BEUC1|nr:UDP-N-acetylglucosamine 2-epimerase (non-hydrolyzing) [Beutenbergia cavernae]ACQ79456.1 UDP-N-acetylglucosamine 2-epimerase [Beutenbergia cavernae DSM 12333]
MSTAEASLHLVPIYGTRPEAIKVAPIVAAAARHPAIVCSPVVTGQHREIVDQVNELFGMRPVTDLDVFTHGVGLETTTARVLERVTPVLRRLAPDVVLVQGDTTSAFAAALAAFYLSIPVVHLEAGLRTSSLASPFPEEGNRRLLTQIASLHLAPTAGNRANLLRSGIPEDDIVVTGNTVIDALVGTVAARVPLADPHLAPIEDLTGPLILVTAHRRESWGEPMRRSARAVATVARRRPDALVVLPMHPNPTVRAVLEPELAGIPNVVLTEPLGYSDLANVLARSTLVVTDSGGLQEEAPALGKPVLVLRENTERPEAVAAGTARLVGTDEAGIVAAIEELLDDAEVYGAMANAFNPYGDGHAAERAIAAIVERFGHTDAAASAS